MIKCAAIQKRIKGFEWYVVAAIDTDTMKVVEAKPFASLGGCLQWATDNYETDLIVIQPTPKRSVSALTNLGISEIS